MKEENWNRNISRVQTWLGLEDRGAIGQAIELSITLGINTGTDEGRSQYWTAIRSMGKGQPNWPLPLRGTPSQLPEDIQAVVDSVEMKVTNAIVGITDADLIATVLLPHGRTGGGYENIEALAKDYAKKAVSNMITAFKQDRWDGSVDDNGIPMMTPPPVKVKEANKEE